MNTNDEERSIARKQQRRTLFALLGVLVRYGLLGYVIREMHPIWELLVLLSAVRSGRYEMKEAERRNKADWLHHEQRHEHVKMKQAVAALAEEARKKRTPL